MSIMILRADLFLPADLFLIYFCPQMFS